MAETNYSIGTHLISKQDKQVFRIAEIEGDRHYLFSICCEEAEYAANCRCGYYKKKFLDQHFIALKKEIFEVMYRK